MTELKNEEQSNNANVLLYAVGSWVRLKPEVENEKKKHRGKFFNVIGYVGKYLELQWKEQKVLFLPDEVIMVLPPNGT
jgi:hypothetical protein